MNTLKARQGFLSLSSCSPPLPKNQNWALNTVVLDRSGQSFQSIFQRKERGLLSFAEKTWLPNFGSGLRPGKNSWWSCARVCLGWVCISTSLAAELLPETRTFQLCICGFSSHLLSIMFILTRNSFRGWRSGGALASMACVRSTVCLWGDLGAVSTHHQCKQYK